MEYDGIVYDDDDEIIDCDGTYEVHPAADGDGWIVVNSATGELRNERHHDCEDAIAAARALNEGE